MVLESARKRAAIVYIENDEGKILSVSRKDDPSQLGLPGGKVNVSETPQDAAIRELKEETGLILSNPRQIFSKIDEQGFETFTFTGIVKGHVHTLESGQVKWVSRKLLLDPRYSPFVDYNQDLFDCIDE